ncbi:BgTH12-05006, partial [Blumeria graminis f. sp. triticale]
VIPWLKNASYRLLSVIGSITDSSQAKSRTIAVRLISMALTGYYKTMVRPRTHRPLSMLKYDPVVRKKVLFLEQKRGGRG